MKISKHTEKEYKQKRQTFTITIEVIYEQNINVNALVFRTPLHDLLGLSNENLRHW